MSLKIDLIEMLYCTEMANYIQFRADVTDQFFDFSIIDRSKSNFRKSQRIDFLRADLTIC